MKRLIHPFAVLFAVAIAAAGGYWLGFYHAWGVSLMADAPVRGSLSLGLIRALENGRIADVKIAFESDIDSGLMWWAQLEEHPLYGALNVLSGHEVVPGNEKYVRRIAAYRQQHLSPIRDPALVQDMLKDLWQKDPTFAKQIEASGRNSDQDIDRMVKKYGQ
jgi:hypothetical protein